MKGKLVNKEDLGGVVRSFVGIGIGWLLGKDIIDGVTATAATSAVTLFAPIVAAGLLSWWSVWAKRQNAAKRGG